MRLALVLAGTIAAAAGAPAAAPALAPPVEGSALPERIPGYELRVLDVPKTILFGVGGEWVRASVPIFFYYPVGDDADLVRLLRRARDDLDQLLRRQDWDEDDLRRAAAEVEATLRRLERPPANLP